MGGEGAGESIKTVVPYPSHNWRCHERFIRKNPPPLLIDDFRCSQDEPN